MKKKQTTETIPNQLLNKHGSFLCKEIISKEICYFITHALLRKSQVEGKEGDEQIPNALTTLHHDLFLETLHEQIWPKLENILGEKLLPTYTYSRLYNNGDILKKHKDRSACEISVTVQLGRSHHYVWPIYTEDVPFYLAEGDGVVYQGCDIEHWRDACSGPKGYYSGQAFFHFVRADGPYANEYGDSSVRKNIPENFYMRDRHYLMETK